MIFILIIVWLIVCLSTSFVVERGAFCLRADGEWQEVKSFFMGIMIVNKICLFMNFYEDLQIPLVLCPIKVVL